MHVYEHAYKPALQCNTYVHVTTRADGVNNRWRHKQEEESSWAQRVCMCDCVLRVLWDSHTTDRWVIIRQATRRSLPLQETSTSIAILSSLVLQGKIRTRKGLKYVFSTKWSRKEPQLKEDKITWWMQVPSHVVSFKSTNSDLVSCIQSS